MKKKTFLLVVFLTALPLFFCNRDANNTQTGKSVQNSKELPLPDTITAAFYNVENLFDFNLDGTEYDEYKPGAFGWTEEVQKRKLNNVASVIAALDSDIVGLSEIENMNVLKELQLELDKMDAVFPYAAVGESPGSATLTALLSKFPIREKFVYPVEKSRSILEALVGRGDDSLRVFVNHWPSKRHPESKRLEAAKTLRTRIDELPPTDDYLIIGDLNSNYNEFATFHTEGFNDTKGQTGINHILKTSVAGTAPRSSKTFVCKGELSACGDCHYNLWLDLPEEKRKSYVFRGAPQTIDHILIPPALVDEHGYSYLKGSFEVFTWDDALLRDGVPYRWQMIFRGKVKYHAGHGFSDHLPIRARFIRASIVAADTSSSHQNYCMDIDPNTVRKGDFTVTVDGWIRGDSRFSVSRDSRFAKSGTHSLHTRGMHESENRTAARARLQTEAADKYLTMSMRGSGNISLRVRRPAEKWVYYNAPDFTQSKSARYKKWSSANRWTDIKIPLPPAGAQSAQDIEVEIRSGKGEAVSMWIDQVRLR